MKIVCISDTHGDHNMLKDLPEGDMIIHAGDCTSMGKIRELAYFLSWFRNLPYKYKLLCPGNHDFCFERDPYTSKLMCEEDEILVGIDKEFVIEGIRFYLTPWTPYFGGWSFNAQDHTGQSDLKDIFDKIPKDVHVVVTHGPPRTNVFIDKNEDGEHCGSYALESIIPSLLSLKYCVFGHIHEGYGSITRLFSNPWKTASTATFVNASMAGGRNCGWTRIDQTRKAFVFEI